MSEKRLRVLVLADARAIHTERYVAELRRQGCFVLLASLEEGRTTYHHLTRRGPLRALWYPLAATEVKALLRRFRPQLVNPHFVSGYGFTAALAGARHHAPVMTHTWGSDVLIIPAKSLFHHRKTAYALRESDVVVGDSEFLISRAADLSSCRRTMVVPWGIERKYLALHKVDYALGQPLRIIVPRAHEPVYNNTFVVRALANFIERGEVTISFPNFGALTEEFKHSCGALIGDRVRLYDRVERVEFLRFMAEHDVYVSASTSDSSPASLIEAMALGLIPVAADIPGVAEWLGVRNGYAFSLADPLSLAAIVGGIIRTKEDHCALRRANLERVQKAGVFEDNIAQIVAVMHELADKKP